LRVDDHEAAGAAHLREATGVASVVEWEVLAAAVDAHDAGRAAERAPHERDAAVLTEVGGRLDAAAGQVDVADGPVVEDAEEIEALGREVDAAIAGERCRGHEDHGLSGDPGGEGRRDGLVDGSHRPSVTASGPGHRRVCVPGATLPAMSERSEWGPS